MIYRNALVNTGVVTHVCLHFFNFYKDLS